MKGPEEFLVPYIISQGAAMFIILAARKNTNLAGG